MTNTINQHVHNPIPWNCINVLFNFRSEKSDCSKEPVPKNKKVVCYQKYLKINLMAFDDRNKQHEDSFYYPSACSCEVLIKKSEVSGKWEQKIHLVPLEYVS